MYTQCPECGTVFRVTAPVLRAAQGQVRCGVCDASFDALRFLSDDVDLDVNAASASRIAGTPVEAPPPSPPRPAPPQAPESRPPREFGAATRNRPSADEERALDEIAALLARGAQPHAVAGAAREPSAERAPDPASPPAPLPAAADEPVAAEADGDAINILEPGDIEEFVLDEGGEDIPDAALEFDLPAESWEQVFVRDPGAPPVTPLDLDLAGEAASADGAPLAAADELVLLEEHDDPLARTDEYRVPDFDAQFELESANVAELEPAPVPELDLEPHPAEPAAVLALEPEPAASGPEPAAEPVAAARPRPAAPVWTPVPTEEPVTLAAGDADAGGTRPGLRRRAAAAAAVVLALGLIAQVVHHFRDSLADSPLLGPALGALYARLGAPLEPRWSLAAYDVRQWGAQSEETEGVLRLRASIVNRSSRAQPFPLLRVTLEDRFGAQVGRREFAPVEYLPGRAAPRELLGAGARADADLSLADPGNQAVGFELDVCLERRGALSCASDAKAGGG